MKRFIAVLLGCWVAVSFCVAGEIAPADQKWLEAVEKMVSKGEQKISTPKETRVDLLKDWAGKNGYSVEVTKTDSGFNITVSSSGTANKVAQKLN